MNNLVNSLVGILTLFVVSQSEASTDAVSPNVASGFAWGYFGKLGLALVAVLIFFMLFAWLMRQQYSGRGQIEGLHIVTSLSVGTRERLVVVQVGNTQVLLGVTQARINKLKTLETPLDSDVATGKNSFKSNLEQVLRKKTG